MRKLRLGVNIDHVATVRNARGGTHPDPIQAALAAKEAGADGITAHLREDRRHIRDADIHMLKRAVALPLNLEMAATEEMLHIARQTLPHACCIVPEKREELTTEGGLCVTENLPHLTTFIRRLKEAGIRVSLFVDPEHAMLDAAHAAGADIVELHTGCYCDATGKEREKELHRLAQAARYAHALGLEVHAGHGLSFDTVSPVAALPEVVELNIGHFLVGEALFTGIDGAIRKMRTLMDEARSGATA